jgi:hypothetical protein
MLYEGLHTWMETLDASWVNVSISEEVKFYLDRHET